MTGEYNVEEIYKEIEEKFNKYQKKNSKKKSKINGNTIDIDELAFAGNLFDYVKDSAFQNAIAKEANIKLTKMADNAYNIHFKEGTHPYKSRTMPGALKGTVGDNVTNKVAGALDLNPVEKTEVNIQNTLMINGAFQVLSIITNQYFLHEINSTLQEIQNEVKKIMDYLMESRLEDVQGYQDALVDYNSDLNLFYDLCEMDLQAKITNIDYIATNCLQHISFYSHQVKKHYNKAKSLDKYDNEEYDNIRYNMVCYYHTLCVYIQAISLYIAFTNPGKNVFENYYAKIKKHYDAFMMISAEISHLFDETYSNLKNKASKLGYIPPTLPNDNALGIIINTVFIVINENSEKKQKRIDNHEKTQRNLIISLSGGEIDALINALDDYHLINYESVNIIVHPNVKPL